MQNIIRHIMPLILLIGLTFSNTVSAFFLGIDGVNSSPDIRCKIEYSQLDLSTGIHTVHKVTSQVPHNNAELSWEGICLKVIPNLVDKINDWVSEKDTNIVANLTEMYCKTRDANWFLWHDWTKYKRCYYYQNMEIIPLFEYPDKVGYNVTLDRMIEGQDIVE
jgi:hypothetical protein